MEDYRTWLMSSEVTGKIIGSISVINMTNLISLLKKRFVREFPELLAATFTLINQVLTCGEIDFNQSCEVYTTFLIPGEVTRKTVGSISVVNMIDLLGEKKKDLPGNSRTMSLTGYEHPQNFPKFT